jgi:iron complex outermembrane receptor protein
MLLSTAGLAIAILPNAAVAAETGAEQTQSTASEAAASAEREEGPVLEEIVVTADRPNRYGADYVQAGSFRGARQIDTPLTVSVIPREVLESQQALQLFDALRNTPGVTSSQTSPAVSNNLSIRGIPVENRGNYRLNGSLPIVNLIDLPIENKERVEALKGASALYYGFTTPSGIINLTTKRPTKDPLFTVSAFGNQFGQLGGHIDAGNTWGNFGARVNLVAADLEIGVDKVEGYRTLQSGAAQWKPIDAVQLNLDVEHIYKELSEPGVYFISNPALGLPKLVDPEINFADDWLKTEAEETNVLGRVAVKISPAWSFIAEAGRSQMERVRRFTTIRAFTGALPAGITVRDFNPATGDGKLFVTLQPGTKYRNNNIRTELAGTFETGPFTHELLVGYSKNNRRQKAVQAGALACGSATSTVSTSTALARNCYQNAYEPIRIPRQADPAPVYLPQNDTSIDDQGFYFFERMKFGEDDWLSLLVGGRKSIYEESNRRDGATFKARPFSVSYGAVIKPKRWVSLYGTYIEGLESTPPAPLTTNNPGEILPATPSKQYEGGIKIEPRRGLLFTAAYFDIRRSLAFTNAANFFVQDGRATYRGAELSLTGEITRDFSVYAGALFLSAKQGQTRDVTLIGKRIENTPRFQGSLSGEYRFSSLLPGFSINGGVYYTGKRAINPANALFIPSFTTVDLGGSYRTNIRGTDVTFRVYADNIFGERYFASTAGNFVAKSLPPAIKFNMQVDLF